MADLGRGAVVITGTSSGIGADAALLLNELGYLVFAGVRRLSDGELVRAEAAHPERFVPLVLDVTDAAQVAGARDEVAAVVGDRGVRAIVSNAGIAHMSGDLSCEFCPLEVQQRLMNVNFFGAVRFVQVFLPLVRHARGTVVFNSALMAHTVLPFNAGYAASKCALEGWADTLRREVAPLGVRVAMVEAAAVSSALEGKSDSSTVPADGPYGLQHAFVTTALAKQNAFSDKPALSPRRVTEKMAQAIESRRPKPRRIAGGYARPIWLVGALPDRVQDAAFAVGLKVVARAAARADRRRRTAPVTG